MHPAYGEKGQHQPSYKKLVNRQTAQFAKGDFRTSEQFPNFAYQKHYGTVFRVSNSFDLCVSQPLSAGWETQTLAKCCYSILCQNPNAELISRALLNAIHIHMENHPAQLVEAFNEKGDLISPMLPEDKKTT